jgi:hypothetical protein
MKFRLISDPGHGWLEVPLDLLKVLGIKDQITVYSYLKGDLAYLEQDCDAALFVQTARAQGITVDYEDVYQDPTPIRNFKRFVGQ